MVMFNEAKRLFCTSNFQRHLASFFQELHFLSTQGMFNLSSVVFVALDDSVTLRDCKMLYV